VTVSTFFSSTADGRIQSQAVTSYSDAREGVGGAVLDTHTDSSQQDLVGQLYNGTTYFCWQLFLDFDTSAIPDTDNIDSVVLSLYGETDDSAQDFIYQARLHDWGGTLTNADYVAGSALSGKTLLATFNTSGWSTTGYNDLTSESSFVSNINKTGVTYIVLSSDRQAGNNAPVNGANERVQCFMADEAGTSKDPKLVVTHSAGGGGGTVLDPFGMSGFFGG
jgi:hypothetical protein